MALLKEDNIFTHVIAIDFGTGASGYAFSNPDMLYLPNILIKMVRIEFKYSILAMAATIRKLRLPFYLIMTMSFWNLDQMPSKDMQK